MSKLKLSTVERVAIWEAHRRKCVYTGEPVSYSELQIDHILPEDLVDRPEEWANIRREYGLENEFEIDSYYNLVPCKSSHNLRKGASVFSKARALFFLQIAENKHSKVVQHLEEEQERLQRGKAVATLTKYLEEGQLSAEEVNEIVSTHAKADAIFKLLHELDFSDGASIDRIAQSEVEDLLERPLLIGANSDIDGVPLTNDADEAIIVRNCREYRKAVKEGFYALTTVAIKLASFFEQQCGLLDALAKAQPVIDSYIADPRVGMVDLNLLPVTLFPDIAEERMSEEERSQYTGITYLDWVEAGKLQIKSVSQHSVIVEGDNMGQYLLEVTRGDFNGDGIEDILVYVSDYAIGGSLGYGYSTILTKTNYDQLFETCK